MRRIGRLRNTLSDVVDYALLDNIYVAVDRKCLVHHRCVLGVVRLGNALNDAVDHALLDNPVVVKTRTRS